MKNFLLQIVSSDSKVSSKRVITFLAFLLMAIGFISNLYWGFKIDPVMFDAMKWIVGIGMGTIVAEKFGNGGSKADDAPAA